jgi:hypothetical protein
MAKSSKTVSGIIIVALILFSVSFIWPLLDTGNMSFSEEDAREYQQASVGLHTRIHEYGHSAHANHRPSPEADDTDDGESELNAARATFDIVRAKRDAALSRGSRIGWIIRCLAILLAAGGVALFVAQEKR